MPTDLRRETGTQLSEDLVSTLPPVCTEMHDRRCSRQRLSQHRRAGRKLGGRVPAARPGEALWAVGLPQPLGACAPVPTSGPPPPQRPP